MPFTHEEVYVPGPQPTLVVKHHDGTPDKVLTGDAAVANATSHLAKGQRLGTHLDPNLQYRRNDVRDSLFYNVGQKARGWVQNPKPTIAGEIAEMGPVAGGVGGMVAGGGLGYLAGLLGQRFGKTDNPLLWGLAGAGLGGAFGGYNGYVRSSTQRQPIEKSAAMFRDPRNFILEKLQGANDLSVTAKAQLAATVRNMDINSASRLADAVRGALGFGVGAIISKFLFGASAPGMLLGGLVGVVGAAAVHHLTNTGPKPYLFGSAAAPTFARSII